MAVKINEKDENLVKEFFSDIPSNKKEEKKLDASNSQSKDEVFVQKSYTVKLGNEGTFKIGFRRNKDYSKLLDSINVAWKNATEKSSENLLKKFDALGFSLEKINKEVQVDLTLEISA